MTATLRKILLLLLFSLPAVGLAQVIANRTTLNSIVGVNGKTADFESYSISSNNALSAGVDVLNSTTIANSQGPGLVPGGVTFSVSTGNIQWDGASYFNSPSREILGNNSAGSLTITFSSPALAFGLDLRAFSGLPFTASVTVYAADNTTVLSTTPSINLPSSGAAVFFGYQAAAGIGKVILSQTTYTYSPIIDNLTFSVIPEPPPYVLLGGGLMLVAMVRRRIRHRENR